MKKFILCILLMAFCSVLSAQEVFGFGSRIYVSSAKADTLKYRILYPDDYNPKEKYPLIVFLHGSGERGGDNVSQLLHGASLFAADSIRSRYKAIVVFPQCPSGSSWAPKGETGKKLRPAARTGELVMEMVDEIRRENKPDRNRLYLIGLSMGAYGAMDLIERYPDTFAAAIAICGGADMNNLHRFAGKTSLRLFHGTDDKAVPVQNSRDIYSELKRLGSDVLYTEYPGVTHGSWYPAFKEPYFLSWLFGKKR